MKNMSNLQQWKDYVEFCKRNNLKANDPKNLKLYIKVNCI